MTAGFYGNYLHFAYRYELYRVQDFRRKLAFCSLLADLRGRKTDTTSLRYGLDAPL